MVGSECGATARPFSFVMMWKSAISSLFTADTQLGDVLPTGRHVRVNDDLDVDLALGIGQLVLYQNRE